MADLGRGPVIMGIVWALTGLAIIVVGLRFYLRAAVNKTIGWDDWTMLIALIFQFVFSAFVTVAFHYGLGMHDVDIPVPRLIQVLKYVWISSAFGIMVQILARVSIVILLVRIFGKRTWFKVFLYTTCVIQSCLGLALIPVIFLQCTPVQGLWNPLLKPACWDPKIEQRLGYTSQSLFTFGDLTYVILPCYFVYKLNMRLGRKVGLIVVLCLGLFTMSCSILKVTYVTSAHEVNNSQYVASISVLWAIIEPLLVIIMGCIPPLMTISKVRTPPYVSHFVSSLTKMVSKDRRKASGASSESDATCVPSKSGPGSDNEKRDSVTTYQVSSVHEPNSTQIGLKEDEIHCATDFTVDRDPGSDLC